MPDTEPIDDFIEAVDEDPQNIVKHLRKLVEAW